MNEQNNKGPKHAAPGRRKKPRRVLRRVLLALLLVFVLLIASCGVMLQLWRSGKLGTASELRPIVREIADISPLMNCARDLKSDLKELAHALMDPDPAAPVQAHKHMQRDLRRLNRELSSPLLSVAAGVPELSGPIEMARELGRILSDTDKTLITPLVEQVKVLPLADLNGEQGVRVDLLRSYLDFGEALLPEAQDILRRVDALDLSFFDEEGSLAALVDMADGLLASESELRSMLDAARAVLGNGEDRLYLFAAQNSSEIRASGGFPGSVGLIRIRDSYLTISDFRSVYQLFQEATPDRAGLTYEEDVLFSGRMIFSWDSDFSPNFERAAEIWAMAYEDRQGEHVDGVISGTPAIIQRLLGFLGSVRLSDGTELNGSNASRVLGHDLYFKYLGRQQQSGAAEYVDQLFAEAARDTMQLFFSQLNPKTMLGFLSFLRESTADRTVMVWMADEEEQTRIRSAGWNAGLNTDPARPEAGIFFNSTVASKMAWFLNIDPLLSAPSVNEDGSQSYDLTVRFSSAISQEEYDSAGGYILGYTGGITGTLYVFAPAGGHIDLADTEEGYSVDRYSYEGLEVAYIKDVTLYSYSTVTVRCRITTAPEAETPMSLIVTPTMQEYR